MSPEIYATWRDILADKNLGDSVLEIGAVPTTDSLLDMEVFSACTTLVGINLDGGQHYAVGGNRNVRNLFEIIEGNANDMRQFPDRFFDTIVSNSVLEHDKYFWRTLSEIRRVAKTGALVVIGTPGYDNLRNTRLMRKRHHFSRWLFTHFPKYIPGVPTLHVHDWPGDYYRFSPQAYREVIFEGMELLELHSVSMPPRLIGVGRRVR